LPGSFESDRLRVVLVNARNPLNIGAAARAMSNFGFNRLRVVNPFQVAFREARSAVGAADLLLRAEQCTSVAEAVGDCALVVGTTAVRHRDLQHRLKPLEEGGNLIRRRLQSGGFQPDNVALLFGSEKYGLSNEDLSHCHWLLHIRTDEEHISMNLGQAVAVCLYELVRFAPVGTQVEPQIERQNEDVNPATAEEVERITQMLFDALKLSGYVKPRTEGSTEEKVRRLIRRLSLRSPDAVAWQGMLHRIVLKLRRDAKK
jgi:TrmH family RNA methyltransferase